MKPLQPGIPFLLSQVGAHAAARYAERIAPLKLKPYHSGILRILAEGSGLTQQALCDLLGMFPSRLVGVLDELQRMKLVERRERPEDRRTYALHLTKAGQEMLQRLGQAAQEVQEDLCATLSAKERAVMFDLLTRMVEQQQITPAVHPGYRQMDGGCGAPPRSK
ncbi:MAG TPA: MarR family winged helix-turn-helix transcriptional regulator [Dongiaceae bacterium]|jgi:DNA-binding MarR family transcriptional regulator|nr:MarR family winged helix-turn-helix transcriptional regulator [Dongiaceae bacterium]